MTKVRKKVDFTGQPVYVGIDVHKKSWTVAVCTETASYRPFSQAADAAVLLGHLHSNYPGAGYRSAYGAGFSGFWTLEISCIQPVRIYPGVPICQIFYHELTGEVSEYTSKYQHNRDIQPSKLFQEFGDDQDPQLPLQFDNK